MLATRRAVAAAALAVGLGACQTLQPTNSKPMSVGNSNAIWSVARSNGGDAGQCRLVSSPKIYSSGLGSDEIRVQVDDSGLVSLVTAQDRFDTRALGQIGLRVDDEEPVLQPRATTPNELTFGTQESARLLQQMSEGDSLRVQIVLFPRKELLTGVYSLRGFESALLTYRMCEVMKAEQNAAPAQ